MLSPIIARREKSSRRREVSWLTDFSKEARLAAWWRDSPKRLPGVYQCVIVVSSRRSVSSEKEWSIWVNVQWRDSM